MKIQGNLDIFISHAWRNHDEWLQVVKIINSIEDLDWRNFSVPWHDPALKPATEMGYDLITRLLKTQIIPCQICFIISELYKLKGNRQWLDLSIEYAKEFKIPIYYLGNDNFFENWDKKNVLYEIDVENIGKIIKDYAIKSI